MFSQSTSGTDIAQMRSLDGLVQGQLFDEDIVQIDAEMRKKSKTFNFARELCSVQR